ncbi:MAG: M61 family peptidase [Cyclobacteriaceae bacterium]
MIKYVLTSSNPASQLLNIVLSLDCDSGETVFLQLPSWRPGRYELANYAQYIKEIKARSAEKTVPLTKITKDRWSFQAAAKGNYEVHYSFFAGQMDAGGSWVDPSQFYLNFINFIFEIMGKEDQPITISLDIPHSFTVATALPQKGKNIFQADHFQHLVDSPLMSAKELRHESYTVKGSRFHVWINGAINFDLNHVMQYFENFTKVQVKAFGSFPAADFHFLIQLLPYPHYHGVEHQFSTVITLGPSKSMDEKANIDKLMKVCSHELYHFWNVCRIRPSGLLPYDFSKEAYFQEGMVAEGVTTYMGDRYLQQGEYYSREAYLKVLENMIHREFESLGWKNQSVAASSWNLWLDGYKPGVPEKKVSIYNRGALLCLCIDLILFEKGQCLQKVMNAMWVNYGEKAIGYTLSDFENLVLEISGKNPKITRFFNDFVWGTDNLLPVLINLLQIIQVGLIVQPREKVLEGNFGIVTDASGRIVKIHPDATAYQNLMIGDHIQHYAFEKKYLKLDILRFEEVFSLQLEEYGNTYYQSYSLTIPKNTDVLDQFLQQ